MTEVIKNDLGEAVRLLTKQLRQIAIYKCQFNLFLWTILGCTMVVLWRRRLKVLGSIPGRCSFFLNWRHSFNAAYVLETWSNTSTLLIISTYLSTQYSIIYEVNEWGKGFEVWRKASLKSRKYQENLENDIFCSIDIKTMENFWNRTLLFWEPGWYAQ